MRGVAAILVTAWCAMGCSTGGPNNGAPDLGAGPPDLLPYAPVLTGTQLVSEAGLTLEGVTTDGLAVYLERTGGLFAVPVGGGKPVKADSDSGLQRLRGPVVFSWANYSKTAGNLGALTVYTAQSGSIPLTDVNGSIGKSSAASPDGQYIAWTANVDPSGTTASVFVGKPDGSVKMEVLTNRSTYGGCLPLLAWWKDVFVVVSCADAGDAGVSPATIMLVDPRTFAVTDLVNNADDFVSLDDAGNMLFAIDTSGDGLVKLRGQTQVTVIERGVADGFIAHDGSAVVYMTLGGALKRWTPGGTITLVAPGNLSGVTKVSGQQGFVTYYERSDPATQLYDVFLASTTAAGQTPSPLVATATGSVFGDAFTVDEKFALYYSHVNPDNFSGTLTAVSTGADGTMRTVGERAWITGAANGSRIVYNDNFVSTSVTGSGYADLRTVDLAGPADPTVIATRADPSFFLTVGRDKVVFTINQLKGQEGLYAAPLQ